MAELRWILLGVAVFAILGIYFFSRSRKKADTSSPLDAANDMPSFSASHEKASVKNSELRDDWSHGVGPVRVVGKTDREIIQSYDDDMPGISTSYDDLPGDLPGDLPNYLPGDMADELEDDSHLAGRHKQAQPIEAWSEEPIVKKMGHSRSTTQQSESDKIQSTHSQSGKFQAGKFQANKFQYEKTQAEKVQSRNDESAKNQTVKDQPTIDQPIKDQPEKSQAEINTTENTQSIKTTTEENTATTGESAEFSTASSKQQTSKAVAAEIDDVIAVYVIAGKDEPPVKGEKVLSASYALHLQYGEMKIFHRYAEAVDSSLGRKDILFSMANIQQPGYFDIDDMHNITTTGMSFFMQVNLVDNPSRVLDDMLICAHRMSTMLGIELCNAQRKPLDEASTTALREQVEQLLEYRDSQIS